MSNKKKVVVTTTTDRKPKTSSVKTTSRKFSAKAKEEKPMTFGKKNYLYMLAGFGLIMLGWLLMSGGAMPSPDIWDDNIIYSFRRITLAPICMVAGLVVAIVGIFKV